ncbi:MAG TPA: helix-turn-helix domain-containing protein [Cyclobacteriaceae bacterium]|nr:helix-turn-helix domain-containing protein [Cyclobacteriaceae bacterium]
MHQHDLIKSLKQRREILGVTQAHLATLAGIGIRTLKEIESGKGNPTIESLAKVADVLGMELLLRVKNPLI